MRRNFWMALSILSVLACGASEEGSTGSDLTETNSACKSVPCIEPTIWKELLTPADRIGPMSIVGDTGYIPSWRITNTNEPEKSGQGHVLKIDFVSGAITDLAIPGTKTGSIEAVLTTPALPKVLVVGRHASIDASDRADQQLFISEDEGATWRDAKVPGTTPRAFEENSLLFSPGTEANGAGLLIVNTGCGGVAISPDLGRSWKTLRAASDFCIRTPIAMSASNKILYVGGEFGIDIVNVFKIDLAKRMETEPAEFVEAVVPHPDYSNHDPNGMIGDPHDPDGIFVGAELSLMHVSGTGKFEYRIGRGEVDHSPTQPDDPSLDANYYRAFWFDPEDSNHMLLGTGGPGTNLIETFDGARTAKVAFNIQPLAGRNAWVRSIHTVPGTKRDVVVVVDAGIKGKNIVLRGAVRSTK